MKPVFDTSGAAYNPERDGSLEEYLRTHDGLSAFPLFHGYAQYKMLWDEGYLVPDWSVIRLMWNVGRGDEHFFVKGEFELVGVHDIQAHAGREGIHDPREILEEGVCFEASGLNPELIYKSKE